MVNEKECFHRHVPYEMKGSYSIPCKNAKRISYFLNKYRNSLYYPCYDRSVYSHCQPFYLMVFDSRKMTCSTFQRKPCSS